MEITWQSTNYSPELIVERYVRAAPLDEGYTVSEVGRERYDLRQGRVSGDELPPEIRAAADALRGRAFAYVVWPRHDRSTEHEHKPKSMNQMHDENACPW